MQAFTPEGPDERELVWAARDQTVRAARALAMDGMIEPRIEGSEDTTVARWSAERQSGAFERAFGRQLHVCT